MHRQYHMLLRGYQGETSHHQLLKLQLMLQPICVQWSQSGVTWSERDSSLLLFLGRGHNVDNQNSILSKMTRKVPKKPHLPKTIILFEKKKNRRGPVGFVCIPSCSEQWNHRQLEGQRQESIIWARCAISVQGWINFVLIDETGSTRQDSRFPWIYKTKKCIPCSCQRCSWVCRG